MSRKRWSISFEPEDEPGLYQITVRRSGSVHRFKSRLPPDIADLWADAGNPDAARNFRSADTAQLTPESRFFQAADLPTLKDIGERVLDAIFDVARPGEGPKIIGALEDRIADNEGIELEIDLSQTAELSGVPWESLYLRSRDRFLAIGTTSNIVRKLDTQSELPPPIERPIRILVVAANPWRDLQTGVELGNIQQRIDRLVVEGQSGFEIEALPAARREDFRRKLSDWKPHIIHYIGHSDFEAGEGYLAFETEEAEVGDRLTAETLRNMLLNYRPWLVVLNSCRSAQTSADAPMAGVAQNLLQRINVPFVIGMQQPVSDEAAIAFSQEFYTALLDGNAIADAVSIGRAAIASGHDKRTQVELITPALYTSGEADRIAFVEPAPTAAVVDVPADDDQEDTSWLHSIDKRTKVIASIVSSLMIIGGGAVALWNFVDWGEKDDAPEQAVVAQTDTAPGIPSGAATTDPGGLEAMEAKDDGTAPVSPLPAPGTPAARDTGEPVTPGLSAQTGARPAPPSPLRPRTVASSRSAPPDVAAPPPEPPTMVIDPPRPPAVSAAPPPAPPPPRTVGPGETPVTGADGHEQPRLRRIPTPIPTGVTAVTTNSVYVDADSVDQPIERPTVGQARSLPIQNESSASARRPPPPVTNGGIADGPIVGAMPPPGIPAGSAPAGNSVRALSRRSARTDRPPTSAPGFVDVTAQPPLTELGNGFGDQQPMMEPDRALYSYRQDELDAASGLAAVGSWRMPVFCDGLALRVDFDLGSSKASAFDRGRLEDLGRSMACPKSGLIVAGLTDSSGDEEFNADLSLDRAKTVADILLDQVDGDSLLTVDLQGYGERYPLVDTGDGVIEERNRRAEVYLAPRCPLPAYSDFFLSLDRDTWDLRLSEFVFPQIEVWAGERAYLYFHARNAAEFEGDAADLDLMDMAAAIADRTGIPQAAIYPMKLGPACLQPGEDARIDLQLEGDIYAVR